ncbi:hypothetical protein SAMN05660875_1253, partial [Stutzerimonas balearica DSM 6083]
MRYGAELAQQVARHECTAGYAQRLISAVNSVMRLANPKWRRVNAVHDCGVPKRTAVRKEPPSGMDAQLVDAAIQSLRLSDQAEGSTPFPRTVLKRLKTSNLAGRLYDAFVGYET